MGANNQDTDNQVRDLASDTPLSNNESLSQSEPLTKDKQSLIAVTNEQAAELIRLIEEGTRVAEAAKQIGISRRTAYRCLQRYDAAVDGVQSFMRLTAHKRLEEWETACDVAARRKGNHAPARDWLLHAGVIEPLQGEAGTTTRIAICIGTPEKPMQVVSPQTLTLEVVSTTSDVTE